MNIEKIGSSIRALRIEKGMTQRELAEIICVSDNTISKSERAAGYPDLSLLPILSSALNVDLNTLLKL